MSGLQAWFNRLWYSPSPAQRVFSALLLPLAVLLQLVARRRRFTLSAQAKSLPVPVVVIGNIAIGGTGKTPVIIGLAKALSARGYSPGVVSRGYGGRATGSGSGLPLLLNSDTSVDDSGDEPALIYQALSMPVCICANRHAAAQRLVDEGCDVILSDDGLQHYRLDRALEVVVVDASRGFGNNRTLPAGPLREPRARLREVDCVVVNGCTSEIFHAQQFSMQLRPVRWFSLFDKSVAPDDFQLAGDLFAISGIGNPQRFFDTLVELGIDAAAQAFSDHHHYQLEDLHQYSGKALLMTAKDAIKCRHYRDQLDCSRWYFLEVEARFDGGFYDYIDHQLKVRAGNSPQESLL